MNLKARAVEKLACGDRWREVPVDLCTGLQLVVQMTEKTGRDAAATAGCIVG